MTETLPDPASREETYLANIAGMDVTVPQPASRKEEYLYAIAINGGGGGNIQTYTEAELEQLWEEA